MTMSRTTRIAARAVSAVAVTVLGMSLAACSGGSKPAADPAALESVTASPSASPAPTKLSPKQKAIEQAEPLVQSFFQMKDESMQDPAKFKYQQFERVAVASAQNYLEKWHGEAGEQGLHQVGTTELISIEATKVDLTFKPKVTPPEIPFVKFAVCYDVTNLDVVDKDGKSVVSTTRKDRGVAQISVANYEYPEGPWLVANIEFPKGKTC